MKTIIVSIILVLFPILMYLVITCYQSLTNKKVSQIIFIATMFTSLYLSIEFNQGKLFLLFCNIPIIICYSKKEPFLAIIFSIIVIINSYYQYDINILIPILKYLSYLTIYIILNKTKIFSFLFLKISALVQGIFILFEYFLIPYSSVLDIVSNIIYIVVIYILTYFSLYLFDLASKMNDMHQIVCNTQKESRIKNSLFKLTHEIKNPLAVCKGYLDMLDLTKIDKSKKYISIIKSEIERSLNVIADFTEFNKIKINKEIIDLTMLLDEITDSFQFLITNQKNKLNYHNEYEEIYLLGDYERLKQVFVNVIKNSLESIASSGIIDIDIFCEEKYATITISDNGIGMNEEELTHIKEMFYTTKKYGTGLGVALSNEIIIAHNGQMDYLSKKNIGTKCIIKLPIKGV